MSREELLQFVLRWEASMNSHERTFNTRIAEGADSVALATAEQQLGVVLPPSLRAFLAEVNGFSISSGAPGQFSDGLTVYDTKTLVQQTLGNTEFLLNAYAVRDMSDQPPVYLVVGGPINDDVALRVAYEAAKTA